ncbi:MAG: TetR/AcrR family transcriptional regulator [Candidatus Bathyarchaeum sp.]|nr:MAG: TetR/AcrR family transcriptional regulator [Candidatus Bathyarchaeum sp.]
MKMSATKQRIFDVAVDLISQKGFNGVPVREIAGNVGIKVSSLYNHFQSKEDILTKIFDYYEAEIEKTMRSKEYLEKRIDRLSAQEFWEKGLLNFQAVTLKPLMQKISKIILLEMFRDERARDIALDVFFSRQQKIVETIFMLMQKKGLIKDNLDPRFLAMEYTYALLAMQFEYDILTNWNLATDKVRKKMFDHIKFISEYTKSAKGGENK